MCVKGKEYAEAERIFRKGAELFPRDQMLSAAALTLGGDSAAYYHGTPDAREGGGSGELHIPPSLADEAFTSFSVPEGQMANWDQADRAAGWEKGLSTLLPRGVVHRSNAPLLPPPGPVLTPLILTGAARINELGGITPAEDHRHPLCPAPPSPALPLCLCPSSPCLLGARTCFSDGADSPGLTSPQDLRRGTR